MFQIDIDYRGTITINVSARTVKFDGFLDAFPAFEMYATANDGAGVAMFQTPPPPGNTPWNLPGDANTPQSGIANV